MIHLPQTPLMEKFNFKELEELQAYAEKYPADQYSSKTIIKLINTIYSNKAELGKLKIEKRRGWYNLYQRGNVG